MLIHMLYLPVCSVHEIARVSDSVALFSFVRRLLLEDPAALTSVRFKGKDGGSPGISGYFNQAGSCDLLQKIGLPG